MNDEVKFLLDKAEQSLGASKLLLAGGYAAIAVVRAYYTMFYLASAFLATENLTFSKHSAVISAFGREFAKTDRIPKKYHQYLKESQDLRNLGDYGNSTLITNEEAQSQIKRAEEFFEFTKTKLKDVIQ